jgi:hypothetical protein
MHVQVGVFLPLYDNKHARGAVAKPCFGVNQDNFFIALMTLAGSNWSRVTCERRPGGVAVLHL